MNSPALSLQTLSKTFAPPGRKTFAHLGQHFFGRKGTATVPPALADITLQIPQGSAFGIVGESGSGKSTLARILCGLLRPTSGQVNCLGREVSAWLKADARDFRRTVQIVFQDPVSSLNPRQRIRSLLTHPLRLLAGLSGEALENRLHDLLEKTGLPQNTLERFPHEFSGGQSQRIALARALAAGPQILVLDEATSALDVSVQAQILNLLQDLQKQEKLTLVFVSHDLGVVRTLCDQVAVLQGGRLIETGPVDSLLSSPQESYTRSLLQSAPRLQVAPPPFP